MAKPNLFLVGAPKCGTTSLHAYLSQHPIIHMSDPKEPHHFGRDLVMTQPRILDRKQYEGLFDAGASLPYRGESSVWYLYSKSAAQELHEYNPDARILISLRDPVELMYSLHGQYLRSINETIINFEEALRAETDRRNGKRIPRESHFPAGLLYRHVVDYVPQINRFIRRFDRDQILIVLFEQLTINTHGTFRRILDFLDLPETGTVKFEIHNKAAVPRNMNFRRFLKVHPKIQKIYGRLPEELRGGIGNAALRLFFKSHDRGVLSPDLRRVLVRELTPEIDRLEELVEQDLSAWKQV